MAAQLDVPDGQLHCRRWSAARAAAARRNTAQAAACCAAPAAAAAADPSPAGGSWCTPKAGRKGICALLLAESRSDSLSVRAPRASIELGWCGSKPRSAGAKARYESRSFLLLSGGILRIEIGRGCGVAIWAPTRRRRETGREARVHILSRS